MRSGEAQATRERVDSDPEERKARVQATSDEASAFLDSLTDTSS